MLCHRHYALITKYFSLSYKLAKLGKNVLSIRDSTKQVFISLTQAVCSLFLPLDFGAIMSFEVLSVLWTIGCSIVRK